MPSTLKSFLTAVLLIVAITGTNGQQGRIGLDESIERFGSVTLEMSLKPFKKNDPAYIREVCRTVFEQWQSLVYYADTVAVMLWTSDGSEILDYSGDASQQLEWGKYIGNPNTAHPVDSGPRHLSLHERAYTYMQDPPEFTYGDLAFIVASLKEAGRQVTGKPIRLGATFDPGPEFAVSTFKYERHPEICMANTMGSKSFVCCYAVLDADDHPYAAYPAGIPQDEPLGLFLGRQSQAFLTDMGFDYLWLSNGFGFGMETWNTVGAIYDGTVFRHERMEEIRDKITGFWETFRRGCPDFEVQTRGTNLSTGIDLARDGVDLRSIYSGGYNILPPPNSPWAAIDGDFGLELTGYMSRIAELPADSYLFRYYTHDPWWANSPWLDRYGREPHDIYLPMAVCRVDASGSVSLPSHLNFLSIDDSYGNMPDQVPNEVIPHILSARRTAPDEPGKVLWVYPFDEYHDTAYADGSRIAEVFYGDWLVRQAVNEGFPLNSVISTGSFCKLIDGGNHTLGDCIVLTVLPDEGSRMEESLIRFISGGGKAIIYGPAGHGSKKFLDFIGIRIEKPLEGIFDIELSSNYDQGLMPARIRHTAQMSGGGIGTVAADSGDVEVLARMSREGMERHAVVKKTSPHWNGGSVIYVRGTNSSSFRGSMLLSPDNRSEFFLGGTLLRYALDALDYSIRYIKKNSTQPSPVNVVWKHDNGYRMAGYLPDQTVGYSLLFPQGAPILTGCEAELSDGRAHYRMPRSWNKECRVFVEQPGGTISCVEMAPVELGIKRKIGVWGLQDATVRVYPGRDLTHFKAMPHNNHHPAPEIILDSRRGADFEGVYFEYRNITGQLVITW